MINDVVSRPNTGPRIQGDNDAQYGQQRRHREGKKLAPLGVDVGHARRKGNHQKGLGRQISIRAVGQNTGFVLDFTPVEIQSILG